MDFHPKMELTNNGHRVLRRPQWAYQRRRTNSFAFQTKD